MEAKGRKNPVREKGFRRVLPTLLGVFILTNGGFGLSVNDIKYSAQPIAAALCYANKQYQNDKGQCEIKWYVSDKNYHALSYLKYPVRIEVTKDGVDKGFRWYFYSIRKNGKYEGGGAVMIRGKEIKNFDFSNKRKSHCEIRWYVSDKNYHALSYLKYPVKIEVTKDGVDKKGFRWYFYSIRKNGKFEGGGAIMIRKPVPKNGLYIRANENLDDWIGVYYTNDKPQVEEDTEAYYARSDDTPWGEVDTFTVPTCSDAYANCGTPDIRIVEAADNILYCEPLRKEFIERGREMSYAEIMNKLNRYVKEDKCSYRACVPGSGGVFCAREGSYAMKVAVHKAKGY